MSLDLSSCMSLMITPICEKCNRKFLGLVVTRMNNKVQNVCFNCYEDYYGSNALLRLTIGTPDKMVEKFKKEEGLSIVCPQWGFKKAHVAA